MFFSANLEINEDDVSIDDFDEYYYHDDITYDVEYNYTYVNSYWDNYWADYYSSTTTQAPDIDEQQSNETENAETGKTGANIYVYSLRF